METNTTPAGQPQQLTRQQLKDLERKELTPVQRFFELIIMILPLACGLRIICTDLPGIRPWLNKALPENGTVFVTPPKMRNTDEPVPESLPDFEHRLARAMDEVRQTKLPDEQQVAALSWDALCQKLTQIFRR